MIISFKKKERKYLRTLYFGLSVDHSMKNKENKKRDNYLDVTRELKYVCNMRELVILIVNGVLGTVLRILVRRLEELEIGR